MANKQIEQLTIALKVLQGELDNQLDSIIEANEQSEEAGNE